MPVTNLTLRGAYTWMPVAEDRVTNLRLIRRPEHAGSLSAAYKFLERFTANASATLTGERRDLKFNPTTFASSRVTNAGYVKLDLGLSCDVCKHFTIFGRAENLLDDRYEEVFGFPALGRTFWGGGTVRF
jgi:vitamin B12 transporter